MASLILLCTAGEGPAGKRAVWMTAPVKVDNQPFYLEGVATNHYWSRGTNRKRCGDGSVFHVKLWPNKPQYANPTPIQWQWMQDHAPATGLTEGPLLLTGGDSGWYAQASWGYWGARWALYGADGDVFKIRHELMSRQYRVIMYTDFRTPGPMAQYSVRVACCQSYVDLVLDGQPEPCEVVARALKSNGWTPKVWVTQDACGGGVSNVPVAQKQSLSDIIFKYRENEAWWYMDQLGSFGSSRFCSGLSTAYYNMMENLPTMEHVNSIQNVLEAASALSTLIKGDFKAFESIPAVGDAWLQYRYAYTTTKGDLEEYYSLAQRLVEGVSLTSMRAYGQFTDGDCQFRAGASFHVDDLFPNSIWRFIDTIGLGVSASKIWDMVPYSFMVDWIVDISGFLQMWEKREKALQLSPHSIWYSISSWYTTKNGLQEVYIRVPGTHVPTALPNFRSGSSGGKTWLMRATDTLSIFFS